MMARITLDVPDSVLSALRASPSEFVREMRIAAASLWYSRGEVSQSVGAAVAGVSRAEFIDQLARRGILSSRRHSTNSTTRFGASDFVSSHSNWSEWRPVKTRNRPVLLSRMAIYAAVDSNALTYLVNAIGIEGYDPGRDTSGLADERIAMARLFMYGDCRLWVPPVVRSETADIPPRELRDAQNRMTWYQLLDHDSGVAEAIIERRVNELLQHHAGANDCRVVAKTEAMELGYLVTRDDRLHRRLQAHTNVQIVRPTDLWRSLDIRCAPPHAMLPAPENPLSAYDWWRLPAC